MSTRETVPNSEDFVVKIVGDATGMEWAGKFTAKRRLSFNDQFRRDQVRRQLLGEVKGDPTPRVDSAATVFSELAVRLTVTPSWWTDNDEGRDLSDENVVVEVYKQVMDIEKKALEEIQKRADKAKEDLKETVADEAAIK